MKPNIKWPSKIELDRASSLPIMEPSLLTVTFAQRSATRLRPHESTWKLRRLFAFQGIRARVAAHTNLRDLHAIIGGFDVSVAVGEFTRVFPLENLLCGPIFKMGELIVGKHVQVKLKCRTPLKILNRADGGRGFVIMIELHGVRVWEEKNKSSKPGDESGRAQSKKKIRRK